MLFRHAPSLAVLSLSAFAFAACDAPTDPADRALPGSPQLSTGTTDSPCVPGTYFVELSVYPKIIDPNGYATPYASLWDAFGARLQGSMRVTWSLSDTTIAHITGWDRNGRPIITGRAGGVTQVIGTCGSMRNSVPLTVTGAPPENGGTAAPVKVTVTVASGSLATGATTQATARAVDSTGAHLSGVTVAWSTSNESVATVSPAGLVTAVGAGSAIISATVAGATGGASVSVTGGATTPTTPAPAPDGGTGVTSTPPSLPRSVPTVGAMPAELRQIRVPAGGNLQDALNKAQLGDAILLAPGATYTGNFVLRDKGGQNACGAWITLRTDGALPVPGERVTPAKAAGFAKIHSANSAPALRTDVRASCYRIAGVEIALSPGITQYNYGLVTLGDGGWVGGGDKQVSLDLVPTYLVLDRVYVHGQRGSNFSRCIALNSAQTAVVNSWISECHAKGFDSQAIEGWNGPGPFLIENNFLAGAGENVMFGGADPGIPNLVPSDITIRRNHVWKDPAWKGVWTVKNLFELKNASRVLVEGNVFENNWADAQAGMAVVIKSATGNQQGRLNWQGTTDVTFRYNVVRNSPRGFNVQANDMYTENHVARVRAEHNLFENIGQFNGTSSGWLLLLTHDLRDVALVHNTFVGNLPGSGLALAMDYGRGAAQRLQLDDNVFAGQKDYAIFYSGVGVGTTSLQAMAGNSWSFSRNVVASGGGAYASLHPQASWYPATVGGIGFAADYSLSASSPYKAKARDGTDPGANIAAVRQMTAGVRSAP